MRMLNRLGKMIGGRKPINNSPGAITQDIQRQKSLGAFLPDQAYETHGTNFARHIGSPGGTPYQTSARQVRANSYPQDIAPSAKQLARENRNAPSQKQIDAHLAKGNQRHNKGTFMPERYYGPDNVIRNPAANKKLRSEAYQKQGTFLPDEAYNSYDSVTPRSLDRQKQYGRQMEAKRRVEARKAAAVPSNGQPVKGVPTSGSAPVKVPTTGKPIDPVQVRANTMAALDNATPSEGVIGAAWDTSVKMGRQARSHFGEQGNLKKAAIGTVQASAVSAAGHAGIAAIQGEDPWEAAKTGAFRGAMVGGGYQGLKAATGANASTIRGNMGQMYRTSRDSFKAHTVAGNAAMRQNPDDVSLLVRKVISQKQGDKFIKNKFNLGGA